MDINVQSKKKKQYKIINIIFEYNYGVIIIFLLH